MEGDGIATGRGPTIGFRFAARPLEGLAREKGGNAEDRSGSPLTVETIAQRDLCGLAFALGSQSLAMAGGTADHRSIKTSRDDRGKRMNVATDSARDRPLAEEKPVKVTLEIPGSLMREIGDYAIVDAKLTGLAAPLPPARLIPPIVERFIASDRENSKQRRRT